LGSRQYHRSLLRNNLVDDSAPNPSVEALLHAFIDHDFVDHTHSSAVLALANQADMRGRVAELYGARLAFVPYVMPGYDLSIEGANIYDAHPGCEGLWLENHGLFTFGPDARTSYERMIEFVSIAEYELAQNGAALPPDQATDGTAPVNVLTTLTRELDRRAPGTSHQWDFRSTPSVRDYLALPNLDELAHRGTATPDHVIRIKPFPLLINPDDDAAAIGAALDVYAARYAAYFERNALHDSEPKTMLDTLPRVVLIRGHGIAGLAANTKAANIASDLAEQTCRVVQSAERYGAFRPLQEKDLFDMEYWSLEQAKLKPARTA
jgi:rhamnose utilization protein RhaD (predicted bifunctional aldolase and dehydrogenase)